MAEFSLPGFTYSVNEAELERYRHLLPEDKLRWLKKANNTRRHLPPQVQELQAKFRLALQTDVPDNELDGRTEFDIL